MSEYTGLLYSKPSFREGVARTLDIGATYDAYNESRTPAEADLIATASDWYAVGADLLRAINGCASSIRPGARHVERSGS